MLVHGISDILPCLNCCTMLCPYISKTFQVNTGLLLVEGEKEAMEKDMVKYFDLLAERSYKEGSASQVHFRLAESQFYRLLTGPGQGYGAAG